jgi:hypothetical protein
MEAVRSFLGNVGLLQRDYTALYPRRLSSSSYYPSRRELEKSQERRTYLFVITALPARRCEPSDSVT